MYPQVGKTVKKVNSKTRSEVNEVDSVLEKMYLLHTTAKHPNQYFSI